MTVHNKGAKAARDRAVLINSYKVMCKDFRVPRHNRLDAAALARLSNDMLYRVNKDLYASATPKQAQRLAVKMGLAESETARKWRMFKFKIQSIFKMNCRHFQVKGTKK
jgi:hypothetical protein